MQRKAELPRGRNPMRCHCLVSHCHSHVTADDPVRVLVHQQLHEGALITPADCILHGLELRGVHVNAARQLLDGLLLTQPERAGGG